MVYVPTAYAVVKEPDPSGTSVTQAFDYIVGGDASNNVRMLVVGLTFAVALAVMAYALKDSFEAMAEGQISKMAWMILLVRVLMMLTILNILLNL